MEFMNNNIEDELLSIQFDTSKKKYVSRNIVSTHSNQCIARIWNNHKSSQCSRKCNRNHLCGIHNNICQGDSLREFWRLKARIRNFWY